MRPATRQFFAPGIAESPTPPRQWRRIAVKRALRFIRKPLSFPEAVSCAAAPHRQLLQEKLETIT